MKPFSNLAIGILMLAASIVSSQAWSGDIRHSTPGLGGYDPVSYFIEAKPARGSGYYVTVHDGVTYAFASEAHLKLFTANPQKYLPAYGGYCAYGVAVGKKFVTDPEVWKIVDGILYLNLDKGIQHKWEKDIPGHIRKANANWPDIKDKAPETL